MHKGEYVLASPLRIFSSFHLLLLSCIVRVSSTGHRNDWEQFTFNLTELINNNNADFLCVSGLDHQGIFRLSGSTTEINDMKQLFENGNLIAEITNIVQLLKFSLGQSPVHVDCVGWSNSKSFSQVFEKHFLTLREVVILSRLENNDMKQLFENGN